MVAQWTKSNMSSWTTLNASCQVEIFLFQMGAWKDWQLKKRPQFLIEYTEIKHK